MTAAGLVPCPPAVGLLVTRAVPAVALFAAAGGGAVRVVRGGLPAELGPVLLAVAVLLGLPHGSLDTELAARPDARRPVRAVCGLAYLAVTAAVFALWSVAPGAAVTVLLVVSAGHFVAADAAVLSWARPRLGNASTVVAAVTGALAVAGPFAWWPSSTAAVLRQLGAGGEAHLITSSARGSLIILAPAGVAVTIVLWRRGARATALEPLAAAALTAACPPLVAFALYFAGWHALRQSCRLLALHPLAARDLRRAGTHAAVRTLVRRGLAPTVVALAGLIGVLVVTEGAVPATVLAALLAVSVPHAAVGAWRESTVRASAVAPAGPIGAGGLGGDGFRCGGADLGQDGVQGHA